MNPRDPDSLNVWCEHRLVGRLWRESTGLMGFQYESRWVDDGFDISRTLPRRLEPFTPEGRVAHIFFANLLPEVAFASTSFET